MCDDFRVDTGYEDLLVIGSVKDSDTATWREVLCGAPHEVVIKFLFTGLLEAVDLDSVRVHAAHHTPDGAVLSRGIHCLENAEQTIAVVGIHHILQSVDFTAEFSELFPVVFLVGVEWLDYCRQVGDFEVIFSALAELGNVNIGLHRNLLSYGEGRSGS